MARTVKMSAARKKLAMTVLKKNMSKKYAQATRYDYLEDDELEMILKAMFQFSDLEN